VQTYEPLTEDVLLIVDEWEAAGTEEAEQLLSTLVDQLSIRFLITTRSRPDWFTPRLEVYGEGLEIGVEELAMTDAEAADVLTVSVAAAGRARLLRTAAGWPAVIGLAAMSGQADVSPERVMSRTLHGYLAQELFGSIAARTQRALMLLAVTGIAEAERARLLLGAEADDAIKEAVARGLLAVRHGSLSLHPLLRDFLTEQSTHSAGDVRDELLGSCSALISNRLWDEALLVAETIPHAEFVCEAITEALPDLLAAGRTSSLLRWIGAARAAGADAAVIDYAESETLLRRGEFDRALVLARKASSLLDGDLAARAHLVSARAAHLGNRSTVRDEHLDAAAHCVEDPLTETDLAWLRFAWRIAEEKPEAPRLLEDFQRKATASYECELRIAEAHILLGLTEGQLDERMNLAELSMSVFDNASDPYGKTSLLNIYANALSAQGRYEEALNTTTREMALAEEFGLEFVRLYALINKARALTGLRRFAESKRALAEVERRFRQTADPYSECQHAMYLAALYLSTGDAPRAVDVLVRGVDTRAGASLRAEFHATRALALTATGDLADAAEQAAQARALSSVVEMRALLAAADAVQAAGAGQASAVEAAARTIFELGARDPLVLACRISEDVARSLLAITDLRENLVRLMVRSRDQAVARRAGFTIPREAQAAGVLSPREREVHELIAHGLTNEEIARLLFISLSTTKVHVKHIFEKLAVRSRLEAARAWYDEQSTSASPLGNPAKRPPGETQSP
jgi:ATP/maltotriose-dependent transcriptional regulator MalT